MTDQNRIAGAPISWGVCEVPGWGHQMPADRVLAEMREVGLAATELGPDGYLPADPGQLAELLRTHHLEAVGGFTPFVLHRPDIDPMVELDRLLPGFVAARAGVMVLSADSGLSGYDSRPELDDDGWKRLLRNLDRVAGVVAEHGIRAVLHPHVGTMVETGPEVTRVLDGASIPLCLDTGHLLIGGTDPAELTRQVPERIAHTHLKDVDLAFAKKVQDGRLTYTDAVREGMYRPLGQGDVDVKAIVDRLASFGYDGWYTLEQDTILTEAPHGEGPLADVRTSVDYLRGVLGWLVLVLVLAEPRRLVVRRDDLHLRGHARRHARQDAARLQQHSARVPHVRSEVVVQHGGDPPRPQQPAIVLVEVVGDEDGGRQVELVEGSERRDVGTAG